MRNRMTMATMCLVVICASFVSVTSADMPSELHKLTASDASVGSVAISGNTAIVGATGSDGNSDNSGAAYLFNVRTGEQLHKLSASDGMAWDTFGNSVSISGNFAIVGAVNDDDDGPQSGSAYLFNVTTGKQLNKLTASDGAAHDQFGRSVAISGLTAIVGARQDGDDGEESGSAYLFNLTTNTQHKLTASDAAKGDHFGNSVAISDNIAIVGAIHNNDGSGSAYLFDVTTGEQLYKLTASDGATWDQFGYSVSISGNIAIIGAPTDDDHGKSSGSVYLFDVTTGEQLTKLTASDATAVDVFGSSVSISDNTVIVGAPDDDDDGSRSGSVYLFDVTTGEQLTKLTASDATANDVFGSGVSISGNTTIVGASGSAYLFGAKLILGDINNDGLVDGFDVDPFVEMLLWGPYQMEADINGDGQVNGHDVDPFVALVLGENNSPEGVEVPEPMTLALLGLGGVVAMRRRQQSTL